MIIDHKFMDKSVSQGKNKYRIAAVFCNKKPKGMNFMKKLLSAAFCLSLICTGLTACGDKDDNSSNASSRDSSAADSNISATDASIDSSTENYTDNTDNTVNNNNNNNTATDNGNSTNAGEQMVTDVESAADDLISDGERIIDDAGDTLTGNDNR